MEYKQKRLNIAIDADLHTELKVAVAKKGITIVQFVVEAIREKIDREK
ncbi:MAG: plasmid partition protein ParG [Sedimentibacter sp.]